jgi:hypothetical protein
MTHLQRLQFCTRVLLLPLFLTSLIGATPPRADPGTFTVIYNDRVPPGQPPMVLSEMSGSSNVVIVIVPASFNIQNTPLNLPGININPTIQPITIVYNNSLQISPAQRLEEVSISSSSKFIQGQINQGIKDLAIKEGCKFVARVSVNNLSKWLASGCFVPEPTNVSNVACAVGLALKNEAISGIAKKGVANACVYTVKQISPKIVEITVDMKKEAQNFLEELKTWMSFLYTVPGAYWFMAQFQRNGS